MGEIYKYETSLEDEVAKFANIVEGLWDGYTVYDRLKNPRMTYALSVEERFDPEAAEKLIQRVEEDGVDPAYIAQLKAPESQGIFNILVDRLFETEIGYMD